MYAGLFPSAHSFNSSVFANVKFAVRAIVVPTGELKRNLSSPAWMAVVASANRRPCTVFFIASQLAAAGQKITSSNLAELRRASSRNRHPAEVLTLLRRPALRGGRLGSCFSGAASSRGATMPPRGLHFCPAFRQKNADFPRPPTRFRLLFAAVFAYSFAGFPFAAAFPCHHQTIGSALFAASSGFRERKRCATSSALC